jgi:hypothetical protein
LYRFCRRARAELLPAIRATLVKHIKRAHYCANVWKTADNPSTTLATYAQNAVGCKREIYSIYDGKAASAQKNHIEMSAILIFFKKSFSMIYMT